MKKKLLSLGETHSEYLESLSERYGKSQSEVVRELLGREYRRGVVPDIDRTKMQVADDGLSFMAGGDGSFETLVYFKERPDGFEPLDGDPDVPEGALLVDFPMYQKSSGSFLHLEYAVVIGREGLIRPGVYGSSYALHGDVVVLICDAPRLGIEGESAKSYRVIIALFIENGRCSSRFAWVSIPLFA